MMGLIAGAASARRGLRGGQKLAGGGAGAPSEVRDKPGRFGSPVLPGLSFHFSYFIFLTGRSGRGLLRPGPTAATHAAPIL
jgi:hypothetical protein